jgi:hydrogenase nickel incorporation protein HypB
MSQQDRQLKQVLMLENLLHANELIAKRINERLSKSKTLLINMISSPGSGKTTLLEATAKALGEEMHIGVIVGDVATQRDYERLKACDIPAVQIVTGSECHLEAAMVEQALNQLPVDELDVVFIENVGNLICPAEFNLGEHFRVTLLSVPEGEDKVLKYPHAFRTSDALIVTKVDLLKHLNFDVGLVKDYAKSLNPNIHIIAVSAFTGEGMSEWLEMIRMWRKEAFK